MMPKTSVHAIENGKKSSSMDQVSACTITDGNNAARDNYTTKSTIILGCAVFAVVVLVSKSSILSGPMACINGPLVAVNALVLAGLLVGAVSEDAANDYGFAIFVVAHQVVSTLASIASAVRASLFPAAFYQKHAAPSGARLILYVMALLTTYHSCTDSLLSLLLAYWLSAAAVKRWIAGSGNIRSAENDALVRVVAQLMGSVAALLCLSAFDSHPSAILCAVVLLSENRAAETAVKHILDSAGCCRGEDIMLTTICFLIAEAVALVALSMDSLSSNYALSAALLAAVQWCLLSKRFYFDVIAVELEARKELHGLRKLTNEELSEYDDVCAVCLAALDGSARMTICGHSFHKCCIARCLQEKPSCPMCNHSIRQQRQISV